MIRSISGSEKPTVLLVIDVQSEFGDIRQIGLLHIAEVE